MNTSTTITAENIAIFSSIGTGGHRCTFFRWISLPDLKIYTYRRHRCTFLHRNSLQLLDFYHLTERCYRIYNRLNIHNHHMTCYKNTGYNRITEPKERLVHFYTVASQRGALLTAILIRIITIGLILHSIGISMFKFLYDYCIT